MPGREWRKFDGGREEEGGAERCAAGQWLWTLYGGGDLERRCWGDEGRGRGRRGGRYLEVGRTGRGRYYRSLENCCAGQRNRST
jgi:hypothetical protein